METIDSETYRRLLAREKQKEKADNNSKITRRKPRHLESQLQQGCVKLFRCKYPQYRLLLFAVPNGGHRNATEAKIMQAEGVTPGVSDLLLLVPRGQYHGLCIEMKTMSNKSDQTSDQWAWQKEVESQGYKYIVCRNSEVFEKEIDNYMNLQTFVRDSGFLFPQG